MKLIGVAVLTSNVVVSATFDSDSIYRTNEDGGADLEQVVIQPLFLPCVCGWVLLQ